MKRFFRNIPWRNILIIGLVAVLGIGAVVGITSIAKEERKTISSTVFSRGAIDQNGFYVESDNSIYTKDLIECQGLEIEPDFEAGGHYQVFYYDSNKQFIGATKYFNSQSDGVYTKGNSFEVSKYCRIVITPATPKDNYGNTVEDYKIKFYEVAGIANKFTITVNKEQNFNIVGNLFKIDDEMHRKYYYGLSDNPTFTPVEATENYSSAIIDCTDYKELIVGTVRSNSSNEFNFIYVYFGTDDNNNKLSTVRVESSDTSSVSDIVYYRISVPEGATRFAINYTNLSENGTFVYGVK